jgi:FKBP-type peptidyl-prolyl cis-trans isomerase FklB
MKLRLIIMTGLLLAAVPAFGADEALPKDAKEKLSYAVGLIWANNLKQQSIEVDSGMLVKGFQHGLSGSKPLLTEEEIREIMTKLQKDVAAKMEDRKKNAAEINKKEGETFLAENQKKEGVKVLPSGLQYKVVQNGTGKSPKQKDYVVVHYRGLRLNGTQFDGTVQSDKPATFKLEQVVKGWQEALLLMNPGSKWRIFVPPHLAYGEQGAGPIEPNSTLIFDVELVDIYTYPDSSTKPAEKSPAPAAKPTKPAGKK